MLAYLPTPTTIEVTTLWRYRNLCIIIVIIILTSVSLYVYFSARCLKN